MKWIKKGIQINSDSHEGTEWLHQLILETKIKLEKQPNYLNNYRMIKLPNTINESTIIDISGTKHAVVAVEKAILYQLEERLLFVKPTDVIVADLLYIYSKIQTSSTPYEPAKALVALALEYGFHDKALLNKELWLYNNSHTGAKVTRYIRNIFIVIIGSVYIFTAIAMRSVFLRKREAKETE